jgi:hypothetical protein
VDLRSEPLEQYYRVVLVIATLVARDHSSQGQGYDGMKRATPYRETRAWYPERVFVSCATVEEARTVGRNRMVWRIRVQRTPDHTILWEGVDKIDGQALDEIVHVPR